MADPETYHVSGPFHSLLEPLTVSIAARNGSGTKWEGLLTVTEHVAASTQSYHTVSSLATPLNRTDFHTKQKFNTRTENNGGLITFRGYVYIAWSFSQMCNTLRKEKPGLEWEVTWEKMSP